MTKPIERGELQQKLEAGAIRLAEALPARHYLDAHLPGAVHLPHDKVAEIAAEALPDKEAEIVVYCASPSCKNSHLAAEALQKLGYSQIRVYGGGKQDWAAAGLAFESGGTTR